MDPDVPPAALDAVERPAARERLLEAGLTLFGTDGYETTTIQAICHEARVSTRDFYRHVGDRIGLFRILFEREVEQIQASYTAQLQSAPPQWPIRARLWVENWVYRMLDDPRRFRIMYTEAIGVSPDLDRRRQAVLHGSVELGITQMALCAEARGEHHPPRHYEVPAIAIRGAVRDILDRYLQGGLASVGVATVVDDMVRIAVMLGEHW